MHAEFFTEESHRKTDLGTDGRLVLNRLLRSVDLYGLGFYHWRVLYTR